MPDEIDEEDEHEDSTDRKMKAEAKSNRKIADLEITNRSLLAINSTLEATKHRQAKEIRDLRRKLRESILVLPPRAYHAAKSSMTEDGILKDEEEEEEEEEEGEDDAEDDTVLDKTDESYRRVKSLLENLLETGRRALASKPADFVGSGSHGAKVLSEEEARTWRGDDIAEAETRSILEDDASSFMSQSAGDDDPSRPLTPLRPTFTSEEEVETSLMLSSDADESASALPPITVTPSPSP
ncbi:hypothetical protein NM688_g6960 [Phlebia brevispora]|uniref:Uncharacterized protein n=1 Tax=Phlebia brevispora TaxID=194682 RepID=A0ACC1SAZ5_9APHY|nr:hypothetical protein NM688_g6960 [Phlebia brevispora]